LLTLKPVLVFGQAFLFVFHGHHFDMPACAFERALIDTGRTRHNPGQHHFCPAFRTSGTPYDLGWRWSRVHVSISQYAPLTPLNNMSITKTQGMTALSKTLVLVAGAGVTTRSYRCRREHNALSHRRLTDRVGDRAAFINVSSMSGLYCSLSK
jgi:hypothetical protein